jgi:hypothetical protein
MFLAWTGCVSRRRHSAQSSLSLPGALKWWPKPSKPPPRTATAFLLSSGRLKNCAVVSFICWITASSTP